MKRAWILCLLVASLAMTSSVFADEAPTEGVTWEVPVERIEIQKEEPERPKLPTLRFLEENLAFLRARIDPLREVREREFEVKKEIDPRYLSLLAMERELAQHRKAQRDAGGDSVVTNALAIAEVEAELDRVEDIMQSAEQRLARLETDFVQRQSTGFLCVLQGRENLPDEVALHWEDGRKSVLLLGAEEHAYLAGGGLLELFHDLVEPRAQYVQLSCASESSGRRAGYLELDPARDRLSVLELDVSEWKTGEALEQVQAQLWVLPNPEWQEETGWMW